MHNYEISELEQQLAKAQSPIEQAVALNALAWVLMSIDSPRARSLAEKALDISLQHGDKNGLATSQLVLGTYEIEYGTTLKSQELLEKALPHFRDARDEFHWARTLDSLGWCHYIKGEYEDALQCHRKAMKMREVAGDPREIVDSLNSISAVYCDQGKYPEAFESLLRAIEMAEQYLGTRDLIRLLSNTGCTYMEVGENEMALQSFERVLELAVDLQYRKNRSFTLASMAMLFLDEGDYHKCLGYSTQSLEISLDQIPKYQLADTYINMGSAYRHLDNYEDAEKYLQMGIDICREIGDITTEAKGLMAYGQLLAVLDRLDESLACLEDGLVKARETSYPQMTYMIHEALANTYEKLGRFQEAYCQFREFQTIKETVFNRDSIARRRLMELKFDLDRAKEERHVSENLRKAGLALNATLDVDHVLDIILEQVQNIIPFDAASIYFLEGDQVSPVRSRGYEHLNQGVIDCSHKAVFQIKEYLNLSWMVETGQPLSIPDTSTTPHWDPCSEAAGMRSWIGVPIAGRDRVVAFISLSSRKVNAYQQRQAGTLAVYASQAGLALENSRLFVEMQRMAITDGLTGLYNHRYLYYVGQRMVEQNRRYGLKLSAIMLDLDHFKEINDRYGHLVGDRVLQELGAKFQDILRGVDVVGRFGGEEFVVLLPQTGLEDARDVAERLRLEINSLKYQTEDGPVSYTASFGIAELKSDCTDLEALIQAADMALYRAKQNGRNQVAE